MIENNSKRRNVNEPLLQNCSAEEKELCSTKEDKSDWASKKQKDAKNEVKYNMTNYFNGFNVFECRQHFLDRLDESYERACMAIQSASSDSANFHSNEQVDGISDSDEQVEAMSKAKEYRDYVFRNDLETMNVFEHENNLGS